MLDLHISRNASEENDYRSIANMEIKVILTCTYKGHTEGKNCEEQKPGFCAEAPVKGHVVSCSPDVSLLIPDQGLSVEVVWEGGGAARWKGGKRRGSFAGQSRYCQHLNLQPHFLHIQTNLKSSLSLGDTRYRRHFTLRLFLLEIEQGTSH